MKFYLVFIYIMLASFLYGQSIEVTTSADTILLGNYIELNITIENIEGDFSEPFIEGAEIISGPNVSSSIQIINGDKSSTQSYSYYIKPHDIGYVHIGPSSIKNSEIGVETEPLEIPVVANPTNIIIEPNKQGSSSFFFDFNRTSPFKKQKKEKPQASERKYKRI